VTTATSNHRRRDAGFTLVELLISMVLVTIVTGAALGAFTSALRATDTLTQKLEMNDQLRIALDLMVRDFIQVGQGLPATKVITAPSGGTSTPIRRPAPPTLAYTFPANTTEFNAVITGDGMGLLSNGLASDMVTVVYADNLPCQAPCADPFAAVNVTIAANGSTATVTDAGRPVSGVTDAVKTGDLLMFTNGLGTAMQMATADPTSQTIAFDTSDAMNLNQRWSATTGTIRQLDPEPANSSNTYTASMTRIRAVSYYLDTVTDPAFPRLVRQINMNSGRVVAFGIEGMQFTYDLVDGDLNPTDVASPATPNQIRKVNIALAARSQERSTQTDDFFRATIATQVSFRSLALRDRYR
jgi:prepilin-type N-terminal cleavage/methylation domain-containing protein